METNQYLDMFLAESREHLQAVNDQLLNLEANPKDIAIVQEIFRSAHTLKGMAATMDFKDITDLTHTMENVLDNIRNEKMTVTTDVLDVLLEAVESLENMVESISDGGDGQRDVQQLIERLSSIGNGDEVAVTVENNAGNISSQLSIDEFERAVIVQSQDQGFHPFLITVVLNRGCILKAARTLMVFDVLETLGEVIKSQPPVDLLEEERFDSEFSVVLLTKAGKTEIEKKILKVSEIDQALVSELDVNNFENKPTTSKIINNNGNSDSVDPKNNKETVNKRVTSQSAKTIRVNIERLDHLMNLFEELVIDRGRLEDIAKNMENKELSETVEHMSRVAGDLQTIVLTMRMVPIEQVFNRFPRMVRSLAKELKKQIHFEVVGADTELDRTIIDEIGDPLVHLIRNSLDHGIELPEVREQTNKAAEGKVILKAYHSGNHVIIEIEDDGAGINKDKVLQKAVKSEIINEDDIARLSDEEIYQLIFASGFSTSEVISDISGRGVGLDVVKSKIESLGGHVSVESVPHEGSRFIIQLPLTLSIIQVMLVEVGLETYAIPLSSIIETAIIEKNDIMMVHNHKMIDFRGRVIPVISLREIFETSTEENDDDYYSIIIARKGDKTAGIIVDSFIGQQEVVLKSLGNYLQQVFAISGATILGDGQVALIVDCNELIK